MSGDKKMALPRWLSLALTQILIKWARTKNVLIGFAVISG